MSHDLERPSTTAREDEFERQLLAKGVISHILTRDENRRRVWQVRADWSWRRTTLWNAHSGTPL